jgi:DNA-binding CsgD family transcriptional regulator
MSVKLSKRDLSGILERLPQLYSAPDFDATLQAMFDIVGALVGTDSRNFNDLRWADPMGPSGREVRNHSRHYQVEMYQKRVEMFVAAAPLRTDLNVEEVCYGFEQNVHNHPAIAACRRKRGFYTWRLSDLISDRQFLNSPLYAEFYRHFPVRKLIISYLGYGQDREVVIALTRENGSDFTVRDREVIRALNPHLRQAWFNIRALEQARRSLTQSRGVLEALCVAYICLNPLGQIDWMSADAGRMLAEFFPGRRRDPSFLPETLHAWLKAHPLQAGQRILDAASAKPFISLSRDARLEARLTLDLSGQQVLFLKRQATVLSAEGFRFPGLTARESEVLFWIAQGRTNGAIAHLLSASPRTINKHVQSIFQKMGVANRAEAIVAANSLDG